MPRLRAAVCCLVPAFPVVAQGLFVQTARQHFPVDEIQVDRTTLVDLDGDGDLDVVGSHSTATGSGVPVYQNDGAGRFVAAASFGPLAIATTHVVGDVDGDGDPDVVVRGTVLENRGAAGLLAVPIAINELPRQIGDLDGDGRADVLTAHFNGSSPPFSSTITAWMAGPGLSFTPVPLLTMPELLGDLALADLDGDGDLDIVLGTTMAFSGPYVPGNDRVLRNDGGGVFTVQPGWLPNPPYDYTMAVVPADFDGDGDIDCAFYRQPLLGPKYWTFRSNDGSGRLLPWSVPSLPSGQSRYERYQAVDLDRDGAVDFVRTGEWWRNAGHGNFLLHPLQGCPGRELHAVGDVDGDGDLDLVFGGSGTNGSAYRLLLDQGAQSFVDATAYAWEPLGFDAIAGDVDGDGDLDLLRLGGPLHRNDGSGAFASETFPWAGYLYGMREHLADVDRDGDLDVVYLTTNTTSAGAVIELRLALNDGTGHFFDPAPAIPPLALPAFPAGSVVFDADGDGLPDVLLATDGVGVELLINNGAFAFVPDPTAALAFPDHVRAVVAADFDRDGDLDVLTGHQNWGVNSPPLRLLLNDGTGHFADAPSRLQYSSGSLAVHSLVAFDADGDGDLDVLVGNYGSSTYDWRHRFLRNDGAGNLAQQSTLPSVRSGGQAMVGDVDDDGDLDIVAICWPSGLRYWRNNGSGVFTDTAAIAAPLYDVTVQLADLDRDGDADLVVGDRILRSRQWDATAPYLPQLGRAYAVQFGSPELPAGIALPFFSTGRAQVPLPPFGTIGIDLAAAVPMAPLPVSGYGTYVLSIPASPTFVGLGFGIQAALVGGARLHLTPPVYDVVRR